MSVFGSLQEDVVWGWDPKDPTDHFGYQGALVGWPFTSASGADCIVWLTGEEAFLECIKTVGTTKRRTMVGFWGYGQWRVQTSNTQFCLLVQAPGPLRIGPSRPQ